MASPDQNKSTAQLIVEFLRDELIEFVVKKVIFNPRFYLGVFLVLVFAVALLVAIIQSLGLS